MATTSEQEPIPVSDWPTYWFAALERAIKNNDWAAAEQAKCELERLGVTVLWRPTAVSRQEGSR